MTWIDVRDVERRSIRTFMERYRGLLRGRVLDFGAGKPGTCAVPEPYRDLVDVRNGGEYVPYDLGDERPRWPFDVVMCNQVLQYVDSPAAALIDFADWLKPGGTLVLTYATNWDEVEESDLWRITKAGMERLLKHAGFDVVEHERRADVGIGSFRFALGYGVVAKRK